MVVTQGLAQFVGEINEALYRGIAMTLYETLHLIIFALLAIGGLVIMWKASNRL